MWYFCTCKIFLIPHLFNVGGFHRVFYIVLLKKLHYLMWLKIVESYILFFPVKWVILACKLEIKFFLKTNFKAKPYVWCLNTARSHYTDVYIVYIIPIIIATIACSAITSVSITPISPLSPFPPFQHLFYTDINLNEPLNLE